MIEHLPKTISEVIDSQNGIFAGVEGFSHRIIKRNEQPLDLGGLDHIGLPKDYLDTAAKLKLSEIVIGRIDLGCGCPGKPIVEALIERNFVKIPYGLPENHITIASVEAGELIVAKGEHAHDRSEIYHFDLYELDRKPPVVAPDMERLIIMGGLSHAAAVADMEMDDILAELVKIYPELTDEAKISWQIIM